MPLSTPWFAPRLSQQMDRLVSQLGHRVFYPRGQVIFSKTSVFKFSRVYCVRSGIVGEALINMQGGNPLLMTLATNGSFCGGEQDFYTVDPIPRSHWALTDCEILSVPTELLMKLADRDANIYRELAAYTMLTANNDRIGMFVNRIGDVDLRLAVFIASMLVATNQNFSDRALDKTGGWIQLPKLPNHDLVGSLVMASNAALGKTVKKWVEEGELRRSKGRVLVYKRRIRQAYAWLNQLVGWQTEEPTIRTPPFRNFPDL